MDLNHKLVNDIAPGLESVLQGYIDHAAYCQSLIATGDTEQVFEGLTITDSLSLHNELIEQLKGLIASIINTVEPVVEPVGDSLGESVAHPE